MPRLLDAVLDPGAINALNCTCVFGDDASRPVEGPTGIGQTDGPSQGVGLARYRLGIASRCFKAVAVLIESEYSPIGQNDRLIVECYLAVRDDVIIRTASSSPRRTRMIFRAGK